MDNPFAQIHRETKISSKELKSLDGKVEPISLRGEVQRSKFESIKSGSLAAGKQYEGRIWEVTTLVAFRKYGDLSGYNM